MAVPDRCDDGVAHLDRTCERTGGVAGAPGGDHLVGGRRDWWDRSAAALVRDQPCGGGLEPQPPSGFPPDAGHHRDHLVRTATRAGALGPAARVGGAGRCRGRGSSGSGSEHRRPVESSGRCPHRAPDPCRRRCSASDAAERALRFRQRRRRSDRRSERCRRLHTIATLLQT